MDAVLTITQTRITRIHSQLIAGRWAVRALFFLNGMLFATWASRIPAVQAAHHLGNGALGLALFAIALGAVVAMPLAGAAITRFGSDRICRLSAILYGAMLPAIVLAPNMFLFVPALFCFGVGHAALDVAMNAQAVAVEKRYGQPIMSSFHALWSTGGLVGATIGGLLAAHAMKTLAHFTLVVLTFGSALTLIFPGLLKAPEEQMLNTKETQQVPIFPLLSPALLTLGLIAMCVMIGEGAMADWSAVYLRNIIGSSESIAASGYATFSVAMALGRFLGDYVTTKFNPANLVRCGGALAATGLVLALAFTNSATTLIGFALVGAGFATVVPIVFSAAGNRRDISPGLALASVSSLGYLGFLIGPPLIGFAAALFGLRPALGILIATSMTAAVLAASVRRV